MSALRSSVFFRFSFIFAAASGFLSVCWLSTCDCAGACTLAKSMASALSVLCADAGTYRSAGRLSVPGPIGTNDETALAVHKHLPGPRGGGRSQARRSSERGALLAHRLERGALGDVVDEQSPERPAIVGRCDLPVPLLAWSSDVYVRCKVIKVLVCVVIDS